MKINSLQDTREALTSIKDYVAGIDLGSTKVFLALPYTSLFLGQQLLENTAIALAAQNVHYDEAGPYTGEISIEALKEFGVEFVLVGHSERRIIFEEKEEALNKKVLKVLEHGLNVVLCIGETAEQRNSGEYEKILGDQLSSGLAGVTEEQLSSVILAYEPVWAINNPLLNPDSEIKAATPEEAENTHVFIRSWLEENYSSVAAKAIPIQYGGSMKPANCDVLLGQSNIDGGLIGSASLSGETFGPIVESATKQ